MSPVEYGTCPVCGYVMLPVLDRSPCGHREASELRPLDKPGVVYSWTVSRIASDEDGTLLAMADFLDGRIRVTAPVLDADAIGIGDEVDVVPGVDTPLTLRKRP
ncbi:MAG: hypothetical protein Q8Q29_10395 [Actinomycetota bacterium]|jgi:uncharacterized OB-fold protein|nr:hypothetical protein [Actinomycetota bacterium]